MKKGQPNPIRGKKDWKYDRDTSEHGVPEDYFPPITEKQYVVQVLGKMASRIIYYTFRIILIEPIKLLANGGSYIFRTRSKKEAEEFLKKNNK